MALWHQLSVMPNFFQRFNSDVGLIETDAYPRTVDPLSLAATEYRAPETSQQQEKFGEFSRTTRYLDLCFGVRNINQQAFPTPRPIDSHHSDLTRPLESNARRVVFVVASHHHRLSSTCSFPISYKAVVIAFEIQSACPVCRLGGLVACGKGVRQVSLVLADLGALTSESGVKLPLFPVLMP
jgi:hypothetical protein